VFTCLKPSLAQCIFNPNLTQTQFILAVQQIIAISPTYT